MKIICNKFILIIIVFIFIFTICGNTNKNPVEIIKEKFISPENIRFKYSLNTEWKFIKSDAQDFSLINFNDAAWENISVPHTVNADDYFNKFFTPDNANTIWQGICRYRKHFKIPIDLKDKKIFIEFEGITGEAEIYFNNLLLGNFKTDNTTLIFDLTNNAVFGEEENILAIKINASRQNKDIPLYAGIISNVNLYALNKIYHTFPDYLTLKTEGIYVYANNFNFDKKSADINIQAEIKNETEEEKIIGYEVIFTDIDNNILWILKSDDASIKSNETIIFKKSGLIEDLNFWSDLNPYIYRVYSIIKDKDNILDIQIIETGFRNVSYKSTSNNRGIYLNDKFIYLNGYSQNATNEFPVIGSAMPDNLHEYTVKLIKDISANFIRWRNSPAIPTLIKSCNKYGIITAQPLNGFNTVYTGEEKINIITDNILKNRNNPAVLFYEIYGDDFTGEDIIKICENKDKFDPNGNRTIGFKSDKLVDYTQWYQSKFPDFNAKNLSETIPIFETENISDESPRRIWDDLSEPYFGYKTDKLAKYKWHSENICKTAIHEFNRFYLRNINNENNPDKIWSGYSNFSFTDSALRGEQYLTECANLSGQIDAMRIPKELYYARRILNNYLYNKPDIHILGHWNYKSGTKKTVYVVSNCDTVKLFINNKLFLNNKTPLNKFLFKFDNVEYSAGSIKAEGYIKNKKVNFYEISTADVGQKIKLTLTAGISYLKANGSDIALIDIEALDKNCVRNPIDKSKISISVEGPAVILGGFNSHVENSINKNHVYLESGINRIMIKSTLIPGIIKIKAQADGLEQSELEIESKPVNIINGLLEIK